MAGAIFWALLFVASAQATGPRWSFSPSLYDFGTRIPGTGPSAPTAFTLTNTGTVDLTDEYTGVNWTGLEGPDPELLTITSNDCTTLSPGESCTIEVAFNPVKPGPKEGTLTAADVEPSPGGASAVAYIKGNGARHVALLSPGLVAFAPTHAGAGPSPFQAVTVTNEGEFGMTISSISLANHTHFDADQFQLLSGGTCAPFMVLPPNGSCTVRVAFAPTAASHFSADLQVADDALDSPQYVTLEGDGLAPLEAAPPQAVIVRHPPKLTAKRFAIFSFRGSATTVRFECQIDGRPYASCQSPIRFGHLAPGPHEFAVRGVDAQGHPGRDRAKFHWRVKRHA